MTRTSIVLLAVALGIIIYGWVHTSVMDGIALERKDLALEFEKKERAKDYEQALSYVENLEKALIDSRKQRDMYIKMWRRCEDDYEIKENVKNAIEIKDNR